jgi:hypothetical protein
MAGDSIAKSPATQQVNKQRRMGSLKTRILAAMAEFAEMPGEYGPPPYNAAHLAEFLGADVCNTSKALRSLEDQGLVVSELAQVSAWNAIAGCPGTRLCRCYWIAATLEQDREAAQAWRDGEDARSEAALKNMFSVRGSPPQ